MESGEPGRVLTRVCAGRSQRPETGWRRVLDWQRAEYRTALTKCRISWSFAPIPEREREGRDRGERRRLRQESRAELQVLQEKVGHERSMLDAETSSCSLWHR